MTVLAEATIPETNRVLIEEDEPPEDEWLVRYFHDERSKMYDLPILPASSRLKMHDLPISPASMNSKVRRHQN